MSKIKKSAIALLFTAILIICSCIALTGCGNSENRIENYSWKFDCVQEKGNDGEIIACSSDSAWLSDGIKVIDLTIRVNEEKFVIADEAHTTYEFTYAQISSSPESTIYEIEYNNVNGIASVGKTYYHDKNEVPTLIITTGNYNLYFYEK